MQSSGGWRIGSAKGGGATQDDFRKAAGKRVGTKNIRCGGTNGEKEPLDLINAHPSKGKGGTRRAISLEICKTGPVPLRGPKPGGTKDGEGAVKGNSALLNLTELERPTKKEREWKKQKKGGKWEGYDQGYYRKNKPQKGAALQFSVLKRSCSIRKGTQRAEQKEKRPIRKKNRF